MILDVTFNPVLRDIVLLLVIFLMTIGTVYVFFRLRTSTFRRVRHLLEERVEIKTKQLTAKNIELEKRIAEGEKLENQIMSSLREKDILLKEIHHRVKNNLQIIISLLNLQSGYIKDEQTLKTVKDGQNRVRAMALVHEKFYQTDEIGTIDFKEYAEKVCYYLRQSYLGSDSNINIGIQSDKVALDMDTAMPCGLLITEIVSNSLKYAFPENKSGDILIRIKNEDEQKKVRIEIADNGVGMPEDVNVENSQTLGLQLINALTHQLDGTLELRRDHGTHYSITFGYPKNAAA